jgi:hypothetical protein
MDGILIDLNKKVLRGRVVPAKQLTKKILENGVEL